MGERVSKGGRVGREKKREEERERRAREGELTLGKED